MASTAPGSVCAVTTESSSDDDPYRDLFRDEPEQPQASEPAAPAADPPPAEPPARSEMVDTGRLFRSVHSEERADAVQAVSRDEVRRLRTLREVDEEPRPAAVLVSTAPPAVLAEPVDSPSEREPRMRRRRSRPVGGPGLRSLGVVLSVGLATLLAGLVDALAFGPGLGVLTGIVLLIASALAALRVRRDDASVSVITPPLAYFVTAISVGQIGVVSTGGGIGRVVDVFFTLADNWIWVVGSTVVAAVIVVVRGRQSA